MVGGLIHSGGCKSCARVEIFLNARKYTQDSESSLAWAPDRLLPGNQPISKGSFWPSNLEFWNPRRSWSADEIAESLRRALRCFFVIIC